MKPTVYIICGVHNYLNLTKRLLLCIKKQTYPSIKTIIIDDASTDGTYEFITRNYPDITLLKGDGHLWWTGALFLGVDQVLKTAQNHDFILTLNNDCTFVEDYLSILVETSLKHQRTIVGSLILDEKNKSKIWDAGVRIDWSKGKFLSLGPKTIEELTPDRNLQGQIDTLSTKGTLYPIEVFHKIGNFDKKHLPHYVSDYEFACRAKRKGFKLILSYKARLYNDIKRTGIGEKINYEKLNFREVCNLMFSRRSRLNIVDHFWFVTLCCPARYKIKNYILLFLKFLYLSLSVLSFKMPPSFIRRK